MVSGIVYFPEIVQSIKDEIGFTNMHPYYDRIKRFIFLAERDIGYGGMIIEKSKNFTLGDSSYSFDGKLLILPEDFIESHFLGDLNNVSIKIEGNIAILTWTNTPPTDITFRYMGVLTDEEGNPITTRNHFEAVINYCIWKLYSPRVFLGKRNASRVTAQEYKYNYTESVLAARGNDAMLSEDDWDELSALMKMSRYDLMAQVQTEPVISNVTESLNDKMIYYGPTNIIANNSLSIKALPSSVSVNVENKFILDTGNTEVNFQFWLPNGVNLESVIDLDALSADITSSYVSSIVSVDDNNGIPVVGVLYTLTQGVPYLVSHRHEVNLY